MCYQKVLQALSEFCYCRHNFINYGIEHLKCRPMCNGLQSKRAGPAISTFLGPHYVPLSPWSGPH
jgi:hypothetical protein